MTYRGGMEVNEQDWGIWTKMEGFHSGLAHANLKYSLWGKIGPAALLAEPAIRAAYPEKVLHPALVLSLEPPLPL